jgi:hypothetical protein
MPKSKRVCGRVCERARVCVRVQRIRKENFVASRTCMNDEQLL